MKFMDTPSCSIIEARPLSFMVGVLALRLMLKWGRSFHSVIAKSVVSATTAETRDTMRAV